MQHPYPNSHTQKLKRFVTSATVSAIHNLPKEEFLAVMQYDESL